MNRASVLVLAGAFAFLPVKSVAGPVAGGSCVATGTAGTAQQFLDLGSTGCFVGPVRFRDFNFSFGGSGGTDVPDISEITTTIGGGFVTGPPESVLFAMTLRRTTGQFGAANGGIFTFTGGWTAETLGDTEVAILGHSGGIGGDRNASNPATVSIIVNADGFSNSLSVSADLVTTGVDTGITTASDPSEYAANISVTTQPGGSILVNDINLSTFAGGPEPPPTGEIPEPATALLLGLPIAAFLAAFKSKKIR